MYERGELGRRFQELRLGFQGRTNPGSEAERKINGAAGEAVVESVASEAEGDPGLAVEIAAMGFFLLKAFIEVISRLVGARRCENGQRKLRGVRGFQRESKGGWLASSSKYRLVGDSGAGKSYSSAGPFLLRIQPDSVSCVDFKRSLNSLGRRGIKVVFPRALSILP